MSGAPSIVPAVGRGLWLSRFHLVLPTGKFPVPLSVVHPCDNAKGRGDYLHTKQTSLMSSKNAT